LSVVSEFSRGVFAIATTIVMNIVAITCKWHPKVPHPSLTRSFHFANV